MSEGSTGNIGPGSSGTTPPPAGTPSTPAGSVGGSGPPTGAGGPTGVVGSTPSHPGSVAPPSAPPAKVWNKTKGGLQLDTAYGSLHATFTKQLPSVRHQLSILARKPLGG